MQKKIKCIIQVIRNGMDDDDKCHGFFVKRLDLHNWGLSKLYNNNSKNIDMDKHVFKINIANYDVQMLKTYIYEIFQYKDKIDPKEIFEQIVKRRKLPCSVDSFYGGRNRFKYYFKLYYYPLVILKHQKLVKPGKTILINKPEGYISSTINI